MSGCADTFNIERITCISAEGFVRGCAMETVRVQITISHYLYSLIQKDWGKQQQLCRYFQNIKLEYAAAPQHSPPHHYKDRKNDGENIKHHKFASFTGMDEKIADIWK